MPVLHGTPSTGARRSRGWNRSVALVAGLWVAVTAGWIAVSIGHGLRAQYFVGPDWGGPPVYRVVDPLISTTWLSWRWMGKPPPQFSIQWSGYLVVDRPGMYTFATTSDDGSFLHIDGHAVVENGGVHSAETRTGDIQLDRGSHGVVLQYSQAGGLYAFEWSWARKGEPLAPIPFDVLSTRPRDYRTLALAQALEWTWLVLTAALVIVALGRFSSGWIARTGWSGVMRVAATALLMSGLAWFYVAGATQHAREVNNFKARGDQSAPLWGAEQIYGNRHGQQPPFLVGGRNYMPVYAAYQSLFWAPWMSDEDFFELAKITNIWLSLVLLAVLGVVFYSRLPLLLATNLLMIVAFGYFIFRAGYVQPELLFYVVFFLVFLAYCRFLRVRTVKASLISGVLAGALAALAHLTKASVPPLMAVFFLVYSASEVASLLRASHEPDARIRRAALRFFAGRTAAAVLALACFLAVLYPYISNSKRVYGSYFYNVNTTFYVWYNDWPEASVGTRLHHDDEGWPTLPPSDIPSMQKYWRTHTVRQIANRVGGGFLDMLVGSYNTFWILKYLVLYLALALALIASNRPAFADLIRSNRSTAWFLGLYGAVYLLAIAFYAPISGTGTMRFLQAHVAPLMFVLSSFFACKPFSDTRWSIAGTLITPAHVHLLVFVTLGLDLTFTLWPRLMSTYGGF
jgi:hypothetical protein